MPISTLSKEQIGPPGLWVVATPIGNLNDLTERAKAALAFADVIFSEDTRVTQKLLHYLGVPNKKLVRIDAHTPPSEIKQWLLKMLEAPLQNHVLVTDAGTPAISDPGSALVRAAQDADIAVTPVPGPSAVTALLSISGFQTTRFTFNGFFPRKMGEKEKVLEQIERESQNQNTTHVWFESPERIEETLGLVCQFFPQSLLSVGKELTKLHETTWSGQAKDGVERLREWKLKDPDILKGEWVFALDVARVRTHVKAQNDVISLEESAWKKTLECLVECNVSTSDAVASIMKHFETSNVISKKQVYDQALLFKKKLQGGIDPA